MKILSDIWYYTYSALSYLMVGAVMMFGIFMALSTMLMPFVPFMLLYLIFF